MLYGLITHSVIVNNPVIILITEKYIQSVLYSSVVTPANTPLLFNMLSRAQIRENNMFYHNYADDTQIYITISPRTESLHQTTQ